MAAWECANAFHAADAENTLAAPPTSVKRAPQGVHIARKPSCEGARRTFEKAGKVLSSRPPMSLATRSPVICNNRNSPFMSDKRFHVDGARVLADLNTLRGIGAYKSGVHKPTFSEPHMRSLEWLRQQLPDAGLSGEIDGIGNLVGTSAKQGPKLLAGSHLESQSYAGWLDGPLGVVYALEAARIINPDPNAKGAVEIAAWCDEEGHFGSFLGSRSYVGDVTDADIDAASDRNNGKGMRDALRDAGLADHARARCERGRHIGYLEAHIEQGEALESSGLKIGIVTSIVGIWQYRITFAGEQNHAGTTRMAIRKDAGLALAKFCVGIDERFPAACGPRTVW